MNRRLWVAAAAVILLLPVLSWTLFSKSIRRWLRPAPEPWNGLFQDPEGLAVDAEGNFYVADEDRGEFSLLDPAGRLLARFRSLEGLDGPLTAGDGMVVVAPRHVIVIGHHKLVEFRIDGATPRLLRVIGADQFQDPEGIARDADGTLYATDEDNRRVQVFDREGKPAASWSVPEDPEGIALAGDRVFVTFSKAGFIGIFDKRGVLQRTLGKKGSGRGEFSVPDYVLPAPGGDLYVTDQKNHRVQVFDREGTFRFEIGRQGGGPGEFEDPEDLAFDPQGNLVVADGGNHRIQILTPRGAFIREIR